MLSNTDDGGTEVLLVRADQTRSVVGALRSIGFQRERRKGARAHLRRGSQVARMYSSGKLVIQGPLAFLVPTELAEHVPGLRRQVAGTGS